MHEAILRRIIAAGLVELHVVDGEWRIYDCEDIAHVALTAEEAAGLLVAAEKGDG